MSDDQTPETLGRRSLLGRSAGLAGAAAAGAVALGVAGSRPATAETGDTFVTGSPVNLAHTPTGLRYRPGVESDPSAAALILTSDTGPALQLLPIPEGSQDGTKVPFGSEPGSFFGTDERPVYSALSSDKRSSFGVGLATLDDIDLIQQPQVSPAFRVLDTTKTYPGEVRDPSTFDASGRLKAGRSIDLYFGTAYTGENTLKGVFLNVHSSGATANGIVSVYAPGEEKVATLHYTKGVSVANFTLTPFALLPDVDGNPAYYIRVYTSATTHVQIDRLGVIADGVPPKPDGGLPHRTKGLRASTRRIITKLRSPH